MYFRLLACSVEANDPVDTASASVPVSGTGTLSLRFELDAVLLGYADSPAAGPFHGSVFPSEGVTGLGPTSGTASLADIDGVGVDLAAGVTEPLWTSPPLPVGRVAVLGFVDTDANALPDASDPDDGDPVTLPGENRFDVVDGADTVVTVFFGLLNP